VARILVIDDEVSVREVTREILVRAGADVVLAPGGEEALAILRHQDFDLIVTDITMPGMDGLEVAREATAIRVSPVLLMSGGSEPPVKERRMRFLRKPFTAARLVADVEALLGEP
jgi:CheY-like chemotaxis protein